MRWLRITFQLLIFCLSFVACSGSAAEAPLEVTTRSGEIDPVLSSIEMSAPWLTSLDLDPGRVVLVPSDHAVLSLDADELALLANQTLEGEVLESGTVWDLVALEGTDEQVVVTAGGKQLPITFVDSKVFIDELGVAETIEWNGLTVIALDGVLFE